MVLTDELTNEETNERSAKRVTRQHNAYWRLSVADAPKYRRCSNLWTSMVRTSFCCINSSYYDSDNFAMPGVPLLWFCTAVFPVITTPFRTIRRWYTTTHVAVHLSIGYPKPAGDLATIRGFLWLRVVTFLGFMSKWGGRKYVPSMRQNTTAQKFQLGPSRVQ